MNDHGIYTARRGELDLRGYEIVRVQFFNFAAARSVTFSTKGIRFSAECIRNLEGTECVRFWLHPTKKSLIVEPCSPDEKQLIRWAVVKNGASRSRTISAAAYIKTLYELFDWSPEYKYRFRGCLKQRNGETSVEFDLREPETITRDEIMYPDDWDAGFGTNYYSNTDLRGHIGDSESVATNYIYNIEPDIKPTALEILSANISDILNAIKSPEVDDGAKPDS